MAMLEGSDGDMWVGTMGGGLNRFDPQTLRAEVFLHDPGRAHDARRAAAS